MTACESVVFCEGFHDRAFWTGWLTLLGCTDPGSPPPGKSDRVLVVDPWRKPVSRGEFGFLSKTGRFVRVVPCKGKERILPLARTRLALLQRAPLDRLVLNLDSDAEAGSTASTPSASVRDRIDNLLQTTGLPGSQVSEGDWQVAGTATTISGVCWSAFDAASPALPDQQTMERLVCAALIAAYPARGKPVSDWLQARASGSPAGPKAFSWSHMAGWYAEHGCEDFYKEIWRDPRVVDQLQARLTESGAWRIAEALAA